MTPEQVATVLAMVSAAEGKPVDEAQVALWMATLAVHNITEEEFRWAVVRHYASSTYPIRPGHVWQIIEPRRDRERVDESLADTVLRAQVRSTMVAAEKSGDWTTFDRLYPGARRDLVAQDLTWWDEKGLRPPQSTLDQAHEFGLLPAKEIDT